jgi:Flp pilus assembly protein TadG
MKTRFRYRFVLKKGQGLLEFTLIVPILLLIAVGLLDLGRAYFAAIVITNAAREGARYLTLYPDDNVADTYGNTFTGTKQAAILEVQGSFINIVPGDVQVTYCRDVDGFPGCDSGFPVVVQVDYDFELLVGWLLPSPVTLTRSARMMVP